MDNSLFGSINPMEGESSSNYRLLFDVVSAAILGVTALAGACAPLYLAGYHVVFGGGDSGNDKDTLVTCNSNSNTTPHRRSLAFVVGNMFSAGVMVSAGLCHLLGEAIRDMNRIQSSSSGAEDTAAAAAAAATSSNVYSHEFPWATFLCGCGLLVTLCADKLASTLSQHQHGASCCAGSPIGMEPYNSDKTFYRGSIELSGVPERCPEDAQEREPLHSGLSRHVPHGTRLSHNDHHAPSGDINKNSGRVSFITAMLMGVALCFHSLLEGAALGAQETITNSMHIFIAIVSHKGLAAYALGSSLVESRVDMEKFWKVVVPFTLASPIGILLGYFLSGIAQGLGAAALSALASGTFLYVAFMEVIPRELEAEDYNVFMKLACLLLGFFMMSTLAIWA